MNQMPSIPSDFQLIEAARSGHDGAWQELIARHEPTIRNTVAQRSIVVRPSVTVALDGLRSSLPVHSAEGERAVRSFRPRAIAAVTDGHYGPARSHAVEDCIADDERLLADAFARLPEPWQTVLWHIHVEQQTAAEVSPLVGRTAIEVTQLLSTAERGLVDAYLHEYLRAADFDSATHEVVPLLGGYVRAVLPPHEQRLVDAHLDDDLAQTSRTDGCRHHGPDESRRLIGVARSVPQVLPAAIAPAITGVSVERHRAALGTATRAFGSAAMSADRSDRVRRAIVIGSAVAVLLALIGVVLLVRQPFDSDDSRTPDTMSTDARLGGPFGGVDAYALTGDS